MDADGRGWTRMDTKNSKQKTIISDQRWGKTGPPSGRRIHRSSGHARRVAGCMGRGLAVCIQRTGTLVIMPNGDPAKADAGWQCAFSALEPLSELDLQRTVTIRREAHSVMQAINRQVAHYSYHCGQIVFLAKHFKQEDWQSLSIPRQQSAEFDRWVQAGGASQR